MTDPRPDPLSEHHDADWGYGSRRFCVRCWGDALQWAPLGSAVVLASTVHQRRAFAHVLELGAPAMRPAWWCLACSGCGLSDAPALI